MLFIQKEKASITFAMKLKMVLFRKNLNWALHHL